MNLMKVNYDSYFLEGEQIQGKCQSRSGLKNLGLEGLKIGRYGKDKND